MRSRLGIPRLFLLIIAVGMILLPWLQILGVRRGLEERAFVEQGVPMRLIAPAAADQQPGVLIAHGFGGSQQIMLGYAYTLAHAGYTTLLWDFGGHAANPNPLDMEGDTLQRDLDIAYGVLVQQPEADPEQIALLGHSMGSGAVMTAGVNSPERYRAVVAVSPTGADVSAELPPNLLLQAGEREPRFVANAEGLLAAAGGANDDFAGGLARRFAIIPQVEHITILFSPLSHDLARQWLDAAFGLPAGDSDYVDVRMPWYLLHLAGWLVALIAISPLLPKSSRSEVVRAPWHIAGLILGPIAATALLIIADSLGDVTRLGSLVVGGAFALWCLFCGLTWLLFGFRLRRFPLSDLWWGLLLFAILWLAFGMLAQLVWLPWLLIPARLLRWPILALAFFPLMWSAGLAQQGASAGRRLLWWMGQAVALVGGVLLAILLVPGLGVLILVLPLLPVLLGIMTITGAVFDRAGAVGIGHSLFFAWLILAYLPMY